MKIDSIGIPKQSSRVGHIWLRSLHMCVRSLCGDFLRRGRKRGHCLQKHTLRFQCPQVARGGRRRRRRNGGRLVTQAVFVHISPFARLRGTNFPVWENENFCEFHFPFVVSAVVVVFWFFFFFCLSIAVTAGNHSLHTICIASIMHAHQLIFVLFASSFQYYYLWCCTSR